VFTLPKRRLGTGTFNRVPGPFGDVADKLDLHRRPEARRCVIDAKGAHHAPAFQQCHADERRDLLDLHPDPLDLREPRIRLHVGHDDGLATRVRIAQRRAKGADRTLSDKRCDT
jgi:hypothetical protein